MKIKLYVPLAIAALALSACGGDAPGQAGPSPTALANEENDQETPSADPRPATSDQSNTEFFDFENLEMTTEDDFVFISSMGAKGTLELVSSDDPRVADLEHYFIERAALDGTGLFGNEISKDWQYLVAEVDNLEGVDDVDMASVTLFDTDMTAFTFTNAYWHVEDSMLLGHIGMGLAAGVDPESKNTSEAYKNLEVSPEEFEKVQELAIEVQDALTISIGPEEQATSVLAMPAEDLVLSYELELVEVAAHGDFDQALAYNLPMDEYEKWLADYPNEYGQDGDVYQ